MKRKFIISIIVLLSCMVLFKVAQHVNLNPFYEVGEKIDSFNNVPVYYNGAVNHVEKRKVTKDGYNLGLQYQCVEFVKRYYYEYLNHKMPDSYGHAKDFFDTTIQDGKRNIRRNLIQYTNESISKPKVNDIVIFDASWYNSFGHVAIVTKVSENSITLIQQNPGMFSSSRTKLVLIQTNNRWEIQHDKIVGWLRKE